MMQERERARRLATTIVSLALALAGLMLVALAIVLAIQGGAGLVFLALVLGVLGAGLAAGGFFFQLVPLRVDELAQEKREYDQRMRGER